MALTVRWFVCPYKRIPDPEFIGRYCSIVDFYAQILADNGYYAETEILGDVALVKVVAEPATLTNIENGPGVFTIPARFYNLEDSMSNLNNGERNQITNAILSLGYTQQEVDDAMGTTLASWQAKKLEDLLNMLATRRLKPRYDEPTTTIVLDGPQQPVKSPRSVNHEAPSPPVPRP